MSDQFVNADTHEQGFTYDPEVFAVLRQTAERYVRNLNGSDRLASAAQTLAMLAEIESLQGRLDTILGYLVEADRYYNEAMETGSIRPVPLYGYIANALKAEALRD